MADSRRIQTDFQYGVRIAVIEMAWDQWEPAQGVYNTSYINQQLTKVAAYRKAGYKIGIVTGLHYLPAWFKAIPGTQHKDQWGNPSGAVNAQFSATARTIVGGYITNVVQTLGQVDFHRVGLSRIGEMLYPEAQGNASFPAGQQVNNWWAFDTAAQTGSGLPAGVPVCPMPGWIPGESTFNGSPVTAGQVRGWYEWYYGALIAAHDWQRTVIRAAGHTGDIHLVAPGMGCLPAAFENRLAINLAELPNGQDNYRVMNTGALWFRFLDDLPSLAGCVLNISSVYDVSGNPRGNTTQPGDDQVPVTSTAINSWSSARWLSSIARRHGLAYVGENPGNNSSAEGAAAIATAKGCGLSALLWAHDYQLHEGVYMSVQELPALLRL
jgi:hypothetical protein